jgi:hypothetical protein
VASAFVAELPVSETAKILVDERDQAIEGVLIPADGRLEESGDLSLNGHARLPMWGAEKLGGEEEWNKVPAEGGTSHLDALDSPLFISILPPRLAGNLLTETLTLAP